MGITVKPSSDIHNEFLSDASLPWLQYRHNDYVQIVGGIHCGDKGSIISVEELGDDPLFLVELESGKDARIQQSQMAPAGSTV